MGRGKVETRRQKLEIGEKQEKSENEEEMRKEGRELGQDFARLMRVTRMAQSSPASALREFTSVLRRTAASNNSSQYRVSSSSMREMFSLVAYSERERARRPSR